MNELLNGERQVAPTLDGIRQDHRARYEWVASRINAGDLIVDAGCGVGYGSRILADAGARVRGYDRSEQAVAFGQQHFAKDRADMTLSVGDLYQTRFPANAAAVCAFEVLEHLADPGLALRRFGEMSDTLYASVPNEDVFPYTGRILHHVRHYTRDQFADLLRANGWEPVEWWGQADRESPVEQEVNGRTLVAVCQRVSSPIVRGDEYDPDAELGKHLINGRVPKSVAILGMGPSVQAYTDAATRHGGRWGIADEVWVVNALGGVLAHDRVFHMDDMAIQEARVDAQESSLVAGMMRWMPHHPHVYTSRAYPEYPHAREYPLEWVLNRVKVSPYFKGTPTYAVAFAIALGVQEIKLFGLDFHYGNGDIKKREKGRACVEFWLGVAEAKGIRTVVPTSSTLFDMTEGGRRELYGYDTEWVSVEHSDRFRVARVPRRPEDIPSAAEMSRRYSHDPKRDATQREPGPAAGATVSPAA